MSVCKRDGFFIYYIISYFSHTLGVDIAVQRCRVNCLKLCYDLLLFNYFYKLLFKTVSIH
jgi:hypothetical protein